jgi:hypothetical protein
VLYDPQPDTGKAVFPEKRRVSDDPCQSGLEQLGMGRDVGAEVMKDSSIFPSALSPDLWLHPSTRLQMPDSSLSKEGKGVWLAPTWMGLQLTQRSHKNIEREGKKKKKKF